MPAIGNLDEDHDNDSQPNDVDEVDMNTNNTFSKDVFVSTLVEKHHEAEKEAEEQKRLRKPPWWSSQYVAFGIQALIPSPIAPSSFSSIDN